MTELEALKAKLEALELANEAKDVENRNLHAQLAAVREGEDATDLDIDNDKPEGQDPPPPAYCKAKEDAARKRLGRLCERKKNGILVLQSFMPDLETQQCMNPRILQHNMYLETHI